MLLTTYLNPAAPGALAGPDGSVAEEGKAAGRVGSCIQCHAGGADNDYIMTGPVGGS